MLNALRRLLHGGDEGHGDDDAALEPRPLRVPLGRHAPYLVDGNTRTFWTHGAPAAETLVEASASAVPRDSVNRRVAALMAALDRRRPELRWTGGAGRPQADPAYSETLFVELMRAGQFRRAWALLAPDCQESWGSPEHFAQEQGRLRDAGLLGVEVRDVRYLPEWTDPERARTYEAVAELDVTYALRCGDRAAALPRTVHLVAVAGRWRSLCFPAVEAPREGTRTAS